MKFKEYAIKFLETKKKEIKQSTYCNYANNLKHVNKYIANQEISKINTKTIEDMCINMINDGYAYKTLSDMKMIAKSVLKQARKENLTEQIIDTINIPKNLLEIAKSKTREEVKIYDETETKKLLDNLLKDCSNKDKEKRKIALGILILMQTGIRIGELCALQWKDIYLNEKYIDINKTIQRIYDPISNQSKVLIGSPKSSTSKRKVPITDILFEELKKYKQNEEEYIISQILQNKPREPRTFRREYTNYLKQINLRYLHPHALRHCFASNLINSGVNVKYASQILGHSNSGITLDVYTHTTNAELVEVANIINKDVKQNIIDKQEINIEQPNIAGLIEILKGCNNVVININTGPVYNNFTGREG